MLNMKIEEKQTLIELWNGNVCPLSDGSENSQETEKLLEYLGKHNKDIYEKLDEEGRESFEKFKDCYDELLSSGCEKAFVKGFSLASKIISEALL